MLLWMQRNAWCIAAATFKMIAMSFATAAVLISTLRHIPPLARSNLLIYKFREKTCENSYCLLSAHIEAGDSKQHISLNNSWWLALPFLNNYTRITVIIACLKLVSICRLETVKKQNYPDTICKLTNLCDPILNMPYLHILTTHLQTLPLPFQYHRHDLKPAISRRLNINCQCCWKPKHFNTL